MAPPMELATARVPAAVATAQAAAHLALADPLMHLVLILGVKLQQCYYELL